MGLLRRHTSVCGRKSFATYGYFDFTCGAYFTLHDEHAEAGEGVVRDDAAYPESKEECKDRTEGNRPSQGARPNHYLNKNPPPITGDGLLHTYDNITLPTDSFSIYYNSRRRL